MKRRAVAAAASPWLAVEPAADPRSRAHEVRRSWERQLVGGELASEPPGRTAPGLRRPIVESWRRSLETGLDPTRLLAPVEADRREIRERWAGHPLGALAHFLTAQVGTIAADSQSLIVVSDAAGLLLHIDGADRLRERAAEMNFVEGARYSEAAAGTNGIGTALAANHALQIFAGEHFNHLHHGWTCSAAPVHDPVSGRLLGVVDLSSPWETVHPVSLSLTTTLARTIEQRLTEARRDQDARLRRRYGDLATRTTDALVSPDGHVLAGEGLSRGAAPIAVPDGGGEVHLGDGSIAVAEMLGHGEAYLVRRLSAQRAVAPPPARPAGLPRNEVLRGAERRARELSREQAALRRVATLVVREAAPQLLFAIVAEEVARIVNVPLVRLVRYEPDGSAVDLVGGWGESVDPIAIGTRWLLDGPGVIASVWQSGRSARLDDYTDVPGQAAAVVRQARMRSAVASPIVVGGRLWGAITVLSPRREPLPEDTEARLSDFTELLATAIANADSRAELASSEERARKLATEQAALRRVATLVARKSSTEQLFAAVAKEVGRIINAPVVGLVRYEADGSALELVGAWSESVLPIEVGTRLLLDGPSVVASVWQTRRPARFDDYRNVPGQVAAAIREIDTPSTVASPILVGGRLWGAIGVGSPERLPEDTEARLTEFTELVATAIANSEARDDLRRLLVEQAALRRVATLVAEGARAEEVFSTVAREVAQVFGVRLVTLCRYESDAALVLASLGIPEFPAGSRWSLDIPGLPATISETGRPVRIDDFTTASGLDALARDAGVRAAVGVPIVVHGSVWGSINVATTADEPFPADAEERLARFTELVATAVANATMRAELAASRARVIAAADETRRRIERNLHDGAQQQLVTLALALRSAEGRFPPDLEELRGEIARVAHGLTNVLEELREMSRGIHPAILTEGGLAPALKTLARRSPVPVALEVRCECRLAPGIEAAAYYTVAEALTNAAKHAGASRVEIDLRVEDGSLHLSIRDDGVGGADPSRGSGLIGLRDRVEALGGTIEFDSPTGLGTRLDAEIPARSPATE